MVPNKACKFDCRTKVLLASPRPPAIVRQSEALLSRTAFKITPVHITSPRLQFREEEEPAAAGAAAEEQEAGMRSTADLLRSAPAKADEVELLAGLAFQMVMARELTAVASSLQL